MARSWGGVDPIDVRSLGAGGDKGETELRLPLRLFFGLCGPYVVLLWLSCGSCVAFSLSALPCLCLAFALSCLCLRPCLCGGFIVS